MTTDQALIGWATETRDGGVIKPSASVARDQGMLAALVPGAIWAQMSTIGVAGIDRVAAMAGS